LDVVFYHNQYKLDYTEKEVPTLILRGSVYVLSNAASLDTSQYP
jgi:hypothetical protein